MAPTCYQFLNATRGTPLATQARVAEDFFSRLRGLLFTEPLQPGEGLYLKPCSQIHMFGMGYALDAVFIDREGKVVGVVESLRPGQVSSAFLKADGCLELPVGTISGTGTRVGDRIAYSQVKIGE